MFERVSLALGRLLAGFLTKPVKRYKAFAVTGSNTLSLVLRPADVLLVEGNQRFSKATKYLTQSTWSHAALYVGSMLSERLGTEESMLIEADLGSGVVAVPLSKYENFNTRICRPVNLRKEELNAVAQYVIDRLGRQYDLKNIVDLFYHMIATPPVESAWRSRLALGSRDPDRVICSTLIAQAFHSIDYPILPEVTQGVNLEQVLHKRDHSVCTPRDFDLSPYFQIIKPTIETEFDHRKLVFK